MATAPASPAPATPTNITVNVGPPLSNPDIYRVQSAMMEELRECLDGVIREVQAIHAMDSDAMQGYAKKCIMLITLMMQKELNEIEKKKRKLC